MSEPNIIRAGDSASWSVSLPGHPPSAGWSLKYRLLWPAHPATEFAATASGDDYAVALSATATSAWPAGNATLVSFVERGTDPDTERLTIGQQVLTVLPNLVTATAFDARSKNRKALDDAEDALAKYMAKGQAHVSEYEIAGRKMKFRSTAEIIELINFYKRAVAKERAAQAFLDGGHSSRIQVRY